jgi:hypothetical protein
MTGENSGSLCRKALITFLIIKIFKKTWLWHAFLSEVIKLLTPVAMCLVTRHGVWIGNWIYKTQIITTTNYSALTNSRTQLLTTAHTKSSQFVFTSRC